MFELYLICGVIVTLIAGLRVDLTLRELFFSRETFCVIAIILVWPFWALVLLADGILSLHEFLQRRDQNDPDEEDQED